MTCETPDEVLRQWALDTSVNLYKKGTGVDRVIKDAERFYGFLQPRNGSVEVLKTATKNDTKM